MPELYLYTTNETSKQNDTNVLFVYMYVKLFRIFARGYHAFFNKQYFYIEVEFLKK